MTWKYNPFTDDLDLIVSSIADIVTKDHDLLDNKAWSVAGHTIGTDGVNIGRDIAEDIDGITFDEGSADGSKPKFWWDESLGRLSFSQPISVSGDVYATGHLRPNGYLYMQNDFGVLFGASLDSWLLWETADADANILILALRQTTVNDVPVFTITSFENGLNKDLGWFDGITEPRIALTDYDADSFIWMGHSADDTPMISTNQAGISFDDKNITNVGDIALDSISSDAGTTVTVNLGSGAGDDFIVGNNNTLVVEGDNERVGIGTNAPGSPLHVVAPLGDAGFGNVPLTFVRQSPSTDAVQSAVRGIAKSSGNMADGFGARIRFEIQDNGAGPNLIAGFGAVRDGNDTSGALIFQTATGGSITEEMRIDRDGLVGIGTNAPGHPLEVNALLADSPISVVPFKFIRNTNNATVDNSSMIGLAKTPGNMTDGFGLRVRFHIQDGSSAEEHIGSIGFVRDGADSQGKFFIANQNVAASSASLVVDTSGNVGIGVTNPDEKLEVNGNIFQEDNDKHIFGTGKDAEIYYNNTDLIIDSQAVGTGDVLFPNDNQALALGGGAGGDMRTYYSGSVGVIDTSVVAASDLHITAGTNKTLVLTETVWEDMQIPGFATRLGASAPDLISFLAAGDLEILGFNGNATMEEIHFTVEIPHNYKEGTNIYWHVHWSPTTTNAGNVKWQLEYSWANEDATYPNVTNASATDAASTTAWDHLETADGSITGSGKTISSVIVCRLFRDPTDDADTYPDDAALLQIDFHYEIDTMGSRQQDNTK